MLWVASPAVLAGRTGDRDRFGASSPPARRRSLPERPFDIERARKLMADANERWAAEGAKAGGG